MYKNQSGAYLTRGLFYETTLADKEGVIYTLKDDDYLGYRSLKRLYLDSNDPTEYTFATRHLGGVDHWDRLVDCSWFKPYVSQWRRELELKVRAEALLRVREIAQDPDHKGSLAANKMLLDGAWKTGETGTKRGRPSKAAIHEEATRLVLINDSVNDDMKRLGLN
jgi:hypothetical protein